MNARCLAGASRSFRTASVMSGEEALPAVENSEMSSGLRNRSDEVRPDGRQAESREQCGHNHPPVLFDDCADVFQACLDVSSTLRSHSAARCSSTSTRARRDRRVGGATEHVPVGDTLPSKVFASVRLMQIDIPGHGDSRARPKEVLPSRRVTRLSLPLVQKVLEYTATASASDCRFFSPRPLFTERTTRLHRRRVKRCTEVVPDSSRPPQDANMQARTSSPPTAVESGRPTT